MLWNEIASAICICCSATIFSISLQGKTKSKLLYIQIFAGVLYLASYLFALKTNEVATIGAITAGFEILRVIVFYLLERNEKINTQRNNIIAMCLFCVVLTVCTILSWCGPISLLPLISAIIVSMALGLKDFVIIKISFIIQAFNITTYLALLSLWINAFTQAVVFVFGIIGLINLIKSRRLKNIEQNKQNDILE